MAGKLNYGLLERQETTRRDRAARILQFYEDDLDGYTSQIRELVALRTKAAFETLPFIPFNFVEYIVEEMAALYKEPPIRTISLPASETKSEKLFAKMGKQQDALRKVYTDLLVRSRINEATKTALSYAWLHNTALVRPIWEPKSETLRFEVYNASECFIITKTGDHRVPTVVAYRRSEMSADGVTDDPAWYVWTETEHYRVSKLNPTAHAVGNNTGMVNPYGTLDIFSVLRLKDKREFWGGGANDLWLANKEIAFQVMLLLRNTMWQGFSIPLAINLGQGKIVYDENQQESGGITISPGIPIEVETRDDTGPTPDLKFVTPEPLLEEVAGVIERMLRMLAIRYRFDPKKMSLAIVSANPQSGVAKSFDQAGLEELRLKTMDPCRDFEIDLYDATRIVVNTHKADLLPEEGFGIDFAEVEIKRSDTDIRDDRDWRLSHDMATVVEFMLEDNPDLLTLEQAMKRWRENKKLNDEMAFGDTNLDPEDPNNPNNFNAQGGQGPGGDPNAQKGIPGKKGGNQ